MATIFSADDDAIPALRALSSENHILLLTPTSPQIHQYDYGPLVGHIMEVYHKSVFCMDYTPPPNSNRYLPYDLRHANALADPCCAGVIVVIKDDGNGGSGGMSGARGTQMDFAKKVWEECGEGDELPALLVEIGGRGRRVGDWQSIVYTTNMDGLESVADVIFS